MFTIHLDSQIDSASRSGRPLALVFVDIDHFKLINDRYGHPRGDGVLRWLGEILKTQIRSSDLAARIGGEEFALVLAECSPPDAASRAEELRRTVSYDSEHWGHKVTISLGVASFESGCGSADDLVAAADRALYEAKAAGRDTVRVSSVR
jgi:diguanylate cyclase (GGDEF)-like protein